jgi:Transposase, Mutator family
MLSVVADETARRELRVDLDELAREGARRMLAAALEAEVDEYLAVHAGERDERGRRLVVRNGHARQREVLTAAGAVRVQAPRVNDRRTDPATGERARFRSVILPPWCRKSPKVAEVLPLLYLHGLSTGDFVPALEAFSARQLGCRRPLSVGCWPAGRPITRPSLAAISPTGTTCTSGRTASTSRCAWNRPACAAWCWWGCAPTAPRSWSRSPTGSGSPATRGPSCCATAAAAGCARRW